MHSLDMNVSCKYPSEEIKRESLRQEIFQRLTSGNSIARTERWHVRRCEEAKHHLHYGR